MSNFANAGRFRGYSDASDAELLSIVCGTSLANAVYMLKQFGSIGQVVFGDKRNDNTNPIQDKARAASELMARAIADDLKRPASDLLDCPRSAADHVILKLGHLTREVFLCMFFSVDNRLLHSVEMFQGTLTQANVYPREVLIEALACNANSVIVAHNHPSGSLTPSPADMHITMTLRTILGSVGITLRDHIIVAGNRSLSMKDTGAM